MLNTLRNLDIRGEISTNVEFLQFVLETKDYKEINVTTEWLETLEWKKSVQVETIIVLGAVVSAHKDFCDEQVKAISDVTRGRGMMRKKMAGLAEVDLNLIFRNTSYCFWAHKESVSRYILGLKNRSWETGVEVQLLADGGFLVSLNCHTYVVYRNLTSTGLQIRVDGKEHSFEKAYDPSKLKAGSSGKLVKLLIQSGTHIVKGQSFAEIEVMKMILTLEALESGIVDFKIPEGSLLQADTVIGTMKLDEPDKTKKTLEFKKSFPDMGDPHNSSPMLKTRLADSVARLKQMMAGYAFTTNSLYIRKYLRSMVDCLREPEMPIHDFYEALSSIHDKIPKSMHQKLESLVDGKDYCFYSFFN
jgi:acetyl-CoA carboxylase/biotin carboxylase 1